jgi:hypothetical protein
LRVEESSYTREQVLAKGSVADDDMGISALLDVLNKQGSEGLGETLIGC